MVLPRCKNKQNCQSSVISRYWFIGPTQLPDGEKKDKIYATISFVIGVKVFARNARARKKNDILQLKVEIREPESRSYDIKLWRQLWSGNLNGTNRKMAIFEISSWMYCMFYGIVGTYIYLVSQNIDYGIRSLK